MRNSEEERTNEISDNDGDKESPRPVGESFIVFGVHSKDLREDIGKFVRSEGEEDSSTIRSEPVGTVTIISSFWLVFIVYLLINGAIVFGIFEGKAGPEILLFFIYTMIPSILIFPIIWYVVIFILSIFTFGTFFRRRHISLVTTQHKSEIFCTKLVVAVSLRGGIMNKTLGVPEFDEWMKKAYQLYKKITYIRVLAVALGLVWGLLEIYQRVNIFPILYQADLWPIRIMMVAVYTILFVYCFGILIKIRNHYAEGDLIIYRVKVANSKFDPDIPISDTYDAEF